MTKKQFSAEQILTKPRLIEALMPQSKTIAVGHKVTRTETLPLKLSK
jgi:hypothetical protein